jgi:predicted transcriptional regulator of viral defense system
MKWNDLLEIVGQAPVFHSSILMAGAVNPADLGRQLSRWVRSGNLVQIRRGLYLLSERYQRTPPHPFLIANRIKHASYVSLQSALEYHGLIPEYVPSITSVTTGRPEILNTTVGSFIFKHIKKALFLGYETIDLGGGKPAFVARPEKALLDLLYLAPRSDSLDYLREIRLQNTETLDAVFLAELAEKSGSRKLRRAARRISLILKELKEL